MKAPETRSALRRAALAYYVLYTFIYAGWFVHQSRLPQVWHYSASYVSFLVGMSLLYLLPTALEAIVRVLGPKRALFTSIPVIGCWVVVHVVVSTHYYITQEHLFDPYVQLSPPLCTGASPDDQNPDSLRILALGGSTTGNALLPEPERYPQVLQDLLREQYSEVPITVLNAGMDWYTTKHSLINYVTYYRDWKPDIVVLMHGINDLCRSFSPPDFAVGDYNDQWSHFYGPAINGAKPPTFEHHLMERLKPVTSAWFSKLRVRVVDYPITRYRSMPMFQRHLENIAEYVREDGATLVLMTQPSIYKDSVSAEEFDRIWFDWVVCKSKTGLLREERPSIASLNRAMAAFNDVTRNLAASEGLLLVDAEQRVEKDLDHFVDDVHYTALGARTVAETVAAELTRAGLIR